MTDTPDNGGPAFPQHTFVPTGQGGGHSAQIGGMTLRDWFAGQALANGYTHHDLQPDKVATWAYQIADAMIAARNSHE